jgi:hypothetical protein
MLGLGAQSAIALPYGVETRCAVGLTSQRQITDLVSQWAPQGLFN